MIYFKIEESATKPGNYFIVPLHDKLNLKSTNGSFNVICARLLNLSYADYLRCCRDVYGATLIGKNHLYPVAYFNNPSDNKVKSLLNLLNARASEAIRAGAICG